MNEVISVSIKELDRLKVLDQLRMKLIDHLKYIPKKDLENCNWIALKPRI